MGAHIGVLFLWKYGLNPTRRRQTPTLPRERGTQRALIEFLIGVPNAAVSDGSGRRRYPLGVTVDP
jgi:hypothetical protein